MNNSLEVLELAIEAAKNFRKAQDLYQPRSGIIEIDTTDDLDESSANFPGYFGETDINLMVVQHLFKSWDLSADKQKENFISILRRESSLDLRQIFLSVDAERMYGSISIFIENLYDRSMYCLENVDKKLSYQNINKIGNEREFELKTFAKQIDELNSCFGIKRINWQEMMDNNDDENEKKKKFAKLRRHHRGKLTTSFMWLIRKKGYYRGSNADEIVELEKCLARMVWLAQKSKDIIMEPKDKLAYINVAFAMVYKKIKHQYINYETTLGFCTDLVQEDCIFPEPYLFYFLLNWSQQSKEVENLKKCVTKLKEFAGNYTDVIMFRSNVAIVNKMDPIFFLKEGIGFDRMLKHTESVGVSPTGALRFKGNNDNNKYVKVFFNGDRDFLTLRPRNLHQRGKNADEVTFTICFTLAGPMASDILSNEAEEEAERIQAVRRNRT